jgi:predicted Zn-dependent protease
MTNNYDDEAIAAFQREVENTPDHLLARLGIAGLKLSSDAARALPYAAEAVKLAPELPEAHYLLRMSLLAAGKVDRSIEELELAEREDPADPKIPFALARAYSRAQRPSDAARARADFSRLKQNSP